MKFIPDLVTSRIHAQIKELSIGSIIELCQSPVAYNEAGIGKAVAAFIKESNLPIEQWTAQERYAAIIHYYINVFHDGEPPLLDEETKATALNYLIPQDYPIQLSKSLAHTNSAGDLRVDIQLDPDSDTPDNLAVVPLTGAWIEAVERVVLGGYVKGITDMQAAWRIALAAAQIIPHGATLADLEANKISIDQIIANNVNIILAMEVSAYEQLMAVYDEAVAQLDHLVVLRSFDDGFALIPNLNMEGGEAIPAFRFQFDSIITPTAHAVWSRREGTSSTDAD